MGARWSDIPPFVERNIETLKLFGVAAKQGGAAAAEAAAMVADAWRNATSEMGSELENLANILMESGQKMKESTAEIVYRYRTKYRPCAYSGGTDST